MGMDVCGRAPTAPVGEYFRRSVWGWSPLALLVETLCPAEAARCTGWYYNGGEGLDAESAAKLAISLEVLRDQGEIKNYCTQCEAWLAALPNVQCFWCKGTGDDGSHPALEEVVTTIEGSVDDIFGPPVQPRPGEPCRVCKGAGTVEDYLKNFHLDESDVDDFIAFLKASGGFSIW